MFCWWNEDRRCNHFLSTVKYWHPPVSHTSHSYLLPSLPTWASPSSSVCAAPSLSLSGPLDVGPHDQSAKLSAPPWSSTARTGRPWQLLADSNAIGYVMEPGSVARLLPAREIWNYAITKSGFHRNAIPLIGFVIMPLLN